MNYCILLCSIFLLATTAMAATPDQKSKDLAAAKSAHASVLKDVCAKETINEMRKKCKAEADFEYAEVREKINQNYKKKSKSSTKK